jgi:hypothetical protein
MKTFMQWAEEKKLDLPVVKENQTRTGQTANYPDGYLRSQYPAGYFTPTKATAFLDAEQKPRGKGK